MGWGRISNVGEERAMAQLRYMQEDGLSYSSIWAWRWQEGGQSEDRDHGWLKGNIYGQLTGDQMRNLLPKFLSTAQGTRIAK